MSLKVRMNKLDITALVTILENFGKELSNMKTAIGEIEAEVNNWITNIKTETNSANDDLINARAELQRLHQLKIVREKELQDLKEVKSIQSITKPALSIIDMGNNKDTSPKTYIWWKERSKIDDGEPVNWELEYADREWMKCNLMVREGWRWCNSSHEDLEEKFRLWTGKAIQWTAVKYGRAKNGKIMMNVKFENEGDRTKVYEMRKELAEEGYLFVGEALSYVERKERWTMLQMSEKLKDEGRDVEFDNRKICVDGEWWKYCWTSGWKRV